MGTTYWMCSIICSLGRLIQLYALLERYPWMCASHLDLEEDPLGTLSSHISGLDLSGLQCLQWEAAKVRMLMLWVSLAVTIAWATLSGFLALVVRCFTTYIDMYKYMFLYVCAYRYLCGHICRCVNFMYTCICALTIVRVKAKTDSSIHANTNSMYLPMPIQFESIHIRTTVTTYIHYMHKSMYMYACARVCTHDFMYACVRMYASIRIHACV